MTNIKKKKLVKLINEALGIKLYDWQVDYIFADNLPTGMHLSFPCRSTKGLTTAQILRLLFRPDFRNYSEILIYPASALNRKGHEVSMSMVQRLYDIYGDNAYSVDRQKEFIARCRIIQAKLDKANIKTNKIRTSYSYDYFDEIEKKKEV